MSEPCDLEAERAVLGGMLQSPAVIADVAALLDRDAFYRRGHGIVYDAIVERGADMVAVVDHLRSAGQLEDAGGAAYVRSLPDATTALVNASRQAGVVRRLAECRVVARTAGVVVDRALKGEDTSEALRALDAVRDRHVQVGPTLPFGRLADKLRDTPPEPDWYARGLIAPGSITLLAARTKTGKSTLLFAGLRAMHDGAAFLGCETRPVKSLILTEERGDTLNEKRQRWPVPADSQHALMRHERERATWPAVVRNATAYCHREGIGLLVIDTLARWVGFRGEEENQSGPVMAAMAPLHDTAATGLAVLLVVHQRKADGAHGTAVRGAGALTGEVDIILELERPAKGRPANERDLLGLSRFTATPEHVSIALRGDDYALAGPEHDLDQRVRAHLREHPDASANEIAAAIGGSRPKALEAVKRVKTAGTTPRRYPPAGTTSTGNQPDPAPAPGLRVVPDSEYHPVPPPKTAGVVPVVPTPKGGTTPPGTTTDPEPAA